MDITTSGGRKDLSIDANKIAWKKYAIGQYIGFRKTSDDSGSWWARVRDASTGKQHYKSLGEFADYQQAKRYDVAMKAALEWFQQADIGITPHKRTVRHACEHHVEALRTDDGDDKADETEKRFQRLVYDDPIASVELGKLRKADLESWRQRLVAKPAKVSRHKKRKVAVVTRDRAPATVNRDMVGLRAALNRARDDGLVVSDIAWRKALKPIENANRRRDIDIDRKDRLALIEAADAEVKPFLRALAMLPLRPGAMAALTVGDFNARLRSLRIGIDKAGKERRITLPATTAASFGEQSKGKLPNAPLFSRADGSHWNKDSWKWPIKAAALDAGLPSGVTAYTLRHSVITDLVTGGLDLLTIAQISGTSVAMIEAHYGHLRQEHAAKALAALAL